MKKRIDLHVESSYSFKNIGSVITPRDLLEKMVDEDIPAVGIVDYCTCAVVSSIEQLRRAKGIDKKIIYGINLNIKYGDLYVPSIILAKNKRGMENIYRIVTLLNEDESYFIMEKDLDKYKTDFIMGIEDFDLEKNYQSVLEYYDYVEVTPKMKREEVLSINDYCQKNNLLLIATSRPKRLDKRETIVQEANKYVHYDNMIIDEESYYYTTQEMLNHFSYLENSLDVVINNAYTLIQQIDDYDLNINNKYVIESSDKELFYKNILEIANLLYLEDIPQEVMTRLKYEFSLVSKRNLEGTITMIDKVVHQAKKDGYYALVGGKFSKYLISYLLGLTPINPLDLDGSTIEDEDINFEIFVASEYVNRMKEYICRLLGTNHLFLSGGLWAKKRPNKLQKFSKIKGLSDVQKEFLTPEMREVKDKFYPVPNTLYLIPSDVDINALTPLEPYNNNYFLTLENLVKDVFIKLRIRDTDDASRLHELEEKTNLLVEEVPLDDKKSFRDSYEIISVEYLNTHNYDIESVYGPRMLFTLDNEEPRDLYDLINMRQQIDSGWLTKCLRYYWDSYYRNHYPEIYYLSYLKNLISYFNCQDILLKEREEKDDEGLPHLLEKVMREIHNRGLKNIIEKIINDYEN